MRTAAEALVGRDNLGWWARGEAMRAGTRELALAYLTLAAAEVARVRMALHELGVAVARRERRGEAFGPAEAA
jgi:hypothetical protein